MFHLVPGRRAVRPATILLAALLSFGLIGVGTARADDFGFKEYTFSSSTCITKKDPINAYYVGNPLGYPSSAKTAVENGLGLKSTLFMSDQYFNAFNDAPNHCFHQDYNRAQSDISPRYHTRLGFGGNHNGQPVTAGPLHHDVLTYCGDVADTFNGARTWARAKYRTNDLYAVVDVYTGNIQAMKQCDGRYTASDGYYIKVTP